MGEQSRVSVISMARSQVSALGPLMEANARPGEDIGRARELVNLRRIQAGDALACHLLSYGALLTDEGRVHDAQTVLVEAASTLGELQGLYDGSHHRSAVLGRILCLSAAVHYNLAVLFRQARSEDNVLRAWANVRDTMSQLTDDDRESELHRTFDSVITTEFPKFGL
ncbi:hypothetical protein SAMN04488590_3206 [Microbacterium sp. 77mftsu3.1]|nr:hypothetical protein SAMN04488590_3206 [Microbacterium sp. 77mftsu3.1]